MTKPRVRSRPNKKEFKILLSFILRKCQEQDKMSEEKGGQPGRCVLLLILFLQDGLGSVAEVKGMFIPF